jgi:BioD-like phosphotransacetylase family protein
VQRHLNIVAVAQLKKLAGIIISSGIEPEAAVLERARLEGIFVLSAPANSFTTAGRLYALISVAK